MRIEGFEIKGLHHRYTLAGELDARVNIFVGNNGSFKSTLLHILHAMLLSEKLQTKYALDLAQVVMGNPKAAIAYRSLNGTLEQLKKRAADEDVVADMLQRVRQQLDIEQFPNVELGLEQYGYSLSDKGCKKDELLALIHTDFISTFDVKQQSDSKHSLLDIKLNELQSQYSFYLSDLAKEMTDIIGREGTISKEELSKINAKKNLMLSFVNQAFSKTGKTIVSDKSRLTFEFDDEHEITSEALSAGEKQLLIILLTVLLEKEKDSIVFLDEPEISLHIDWQYRLIDWLTQLNPNAQFILTTHSPGIFADGWGEHIKYMDDVVQIIK